MINYVARLKKNPVKKTLAWYAQAANVRPLTLDDVVEKIALNCTVTEHDIKAVLSALQEQIMFALREGCSVRLGDLGSFRLTIKSYPSETKEGLTADFIKQLCVRYTPSNRLRQNLALNQRSVRFNRIDLQTSTQAGA